MGKYYLVSLDGTGYFSSKKVHCEACLQRKNKRTGEITYSHQMLGAAIVHPERKAVLPLAPEAIIKQDGEKKNDCERDAPSVSWRICAGTIRVCRLSWPKMP